MFENRLDPHYRSMFVVPRLNTLRDVVEGAIIAETDKCNTHRCQKPHDFLRAMEDMVWTKRLALE